MSAMEAFNNGWKSKLDLTAEEQALLAGEQGEAAARAMRIVTRMAPLYGARRLMPVTRAHIDGCIYEGDAGLEFAERLVAQDGRVRVPTTLNVISLDRARWKTYALDPSYADKARRLGEAYLAMGAQPTFTCAPYQIGVDLKLGEQIAWAESNAVAYANTVRGARTNRYGDYLDICCALTGRVPAAGLHLDGNRVAKTVLRLRGISRSLQERDDFWPVLGYHLGTIVDEDVAAIDGFLARPSDDQLKAFCAAAATSGSVALVHLVGITPEAPTLHAAMNGMKPERALDIELVDLIRVRDVLTTAKSGTLDIVAFGSPHCSISECRELARLMEGRRAAPNVEVWVTTSRAVRDLLSRTDDLEKLESFGCQVTADTCIVVSPLVRGRTGALMTNSAKYAHYAPGIIGAASVFGSTRECVDSAAAGAIKREAGPWTPAA